MTQTYLQKIRRISIYSGALLLILVSLVTLTPLLAFAATPQDTYVWQKNIGESGCPPQSTDPQTLCYVDGVAYAPNGNLYVTDYNWRNIKVYTPDGTLVQVIGTNGAGDGQFNGPQGIAFDSAGDFYVTDDGNSRVQKFSSDGTYLSQFGDYGSGDGQFDGPNGIAVDSGGDIYVVDTWNNRVEVFNPDGTYKAQFGTSGSGNGQLKSPRGIAFDSKGNVYVTDAGNFRIEKFSSDGTYLSQFGAQDDACSGTTTGAQFCYPYSIAIDSSDNVFVGDEDGYVKKFDSNGTYLSKFGGKGTGDGQLGTFILGLAIANDGTAYVGDTQNYRVSVWGTLPSAPQNMTAIPLSATSLKISWAAPSYTGTSPLMGYRVMYRVHGTSAWTTATQTNASTFMYTIANLAPNTQYDIQVIAFNAIGASTDDVPRQTVTTVTTALVEELADTGTDIYLATGVAVISIISGVYAMMRLRRKGRV